MPEKFQSREPLRLFLPDDLIVVISNAPTGKSWREYAGVLGLSPTRRAVLPTKEVEEGVRYLSLLSLKASRSPSTQQGRATPNFERWLEPVKLEEETQLVTQINM